MIDYRNHLIGETLMLFQKLKIKGNADLVGRSQQQELSNLIMQLQLVKLEQIEYCSQKNSYLTVQGIMITMVVAVGFHHMLFSIYMKLDT